MPHRLFCGIVFAPGILKLGDCLSNYRFLIFVCKVFSCGWIGSTFFLLLHDNKERNRQTVDAILLTSRSIKPTRTHSISGEIAMKIMNGFSKGGVLSSLTLGLLLLVSTSSAQESQSFATKGVYELGGTVSYQYTSSILGGNEVGHINVLSILPYAGYFVSDNIEIGINPLGIQRTWVTSNGNTLYTILVAPAYNFKAQEHTYLFVEAQLGYTGQTSSSSFSPSITANGFSWGGRVGGKIQVGNNGLLNLGIQYQQITLNQTGFPGRMGRNTLMLSAGFTFWL